MQHISPSDDEWARAWESLIAIVSSYDDRCPDTGEAWQYMGTYWTDRPAIGALLPLSVMVHEFRHRNRPAGCGPIQGHCGESHGRIVLQIVASRQHSAGKLISSRERHYETA